MFADSPQAHLSPFWKQVHQKERLLLPALKELVDVLWEIGIYPNIEMLAPYNLQPYDSLDSVRGEFRRRLYVNPNSAEDQRLDRALAESLVETSDGLTIRNAQPRRLGFISWNTKQQSVLP